MDVATVRKVASLSHRRVPLLPVGRNVRDMLMSIPQQGENMCKRATLIGFFAALFASSALAQVDGTLPACTDATMADLPSPGVSFHTNPGADFKLTPWMLAHPGVEAEFPVPVVKHPFGTLPIHGFELDFVIDEGGGLICVSPVSDYYGEQFVLDDARRTFLAGVSAWHFKPFLIDGKPARVQAHLLINEEELPQNHVDAPPGDPAQVTITQDQYPQFASFGPYHVELHGDGTAIYTSGYSDDPLGPQTYHVNPLAVQGIVAKAAAADFWSLRDLYRRAGENDGSSFERLNITVGGVTKSLTDRDFAGSGLPAAAFQLEADVFGAANVDFWQRPTPATLDQLKANGFIFSSPQGASLLLQMVQNPSVKDDAIGALVQLGAPMNGEGHSHFMDEYQDLLEAALANGRSGLATRLISGGALLSDGKPDADKIAWTFSDAVYSGDLKSVELILPFHPPMTYPDPDTGDDISILLRLGDNRSAHAPIEVARRLLDLGVDVNASGSDGRTLLDKVVNDQDFAIFLLDHGADINAVDAHGRTVIAWTFDEDTALMLLVRGADPRKGKAGSELRFNIKNNHWNRVKAWLTAHGYSDVLVPQPDDDA